MNLDPEVFREAAERVDQYLTGCCHAIADATWMKYHDLGWPYRDFFHESVGKLGNYGFYFGSLEARENQEHRVLALLLCAEMLENP